MTYIDTPTNTFVYSLNGVDSLIFVTYPSYFEIFSRYEEYEDVSIAKFEKGRWRFVDERQRASFFQLFKMYKKEFEMALRSYTRNNTKNPKLYKLQCFYRLLKIKFIRLKKNNKLI